jgi:predicted nucleic acid-binding Zn ribbon protein
MKKVGDLLREFLKQKGWMEGSPYQPLFAQWQVIAGDALAAHARLLDVRSGLLIVEVDHPGWLQMLRLRQTALLAEARKAVPLLPVEGIRVRLGAQRTADR